MIEGGIDGASMQTGMKFERDTDLKTDLLSKKESESVDMKYLNLTNVLAIFYKNTTYTEIFWKATRTNIKSFSLVYDRTILSKSLSGF